MSKNSFTSLSGLVFRVTEPENKDLSQTAETSKQDPGRFNTGETGAVYVSREPHTAIEELRRQAKKDNSSLAGEYPQSILVINVSVSALTDLTIPETRQAWGLTIEDLTDEDDSCCQNVAADLIKSGTEAVRWISATGEGQSLAIYFEKLLPNSFAEIVDEIELEKDVLKKLESGANVVELIPKLRDFPLLS